MGGVYIYYTQKNKAGVKLSPPVALERLLADCEPGLQFLVQSRQLEHPAQYRLAFRELGLATGLEAIGRFRTLVDRYPARFSLDEEAATQLERLGKFRHLAGAIHLNIVLFTLGHEGFARAYVPLAPRRYHLSAGIEGIGYQLKADLVTAPAGFPPK